MKIEWLGLTKHELTHRLTGLGVPPHIIQDQVEDFIRLAPSLHDDARRFIQTGAQESSVTIKGWNLKRLVEEYKMKPTSAFLTLDWLIREPDAAAKSLAKGYDTIGF